MIKRRFYKHLHGDRDGPSDSSSSSDSDVEAGTTDETELEDDVLAEARENDEACSSSSGYESEDSSAHEVDLDSSGLPTNDDDLGIGNDGQNAIESHSSGKINAEKVDTLCNTMAKKDAIPSDVAGCILKCKSVYKCRLCPRIVCLTEETLKVHLESKRHARSEKLLSEGRLKLMLNSDGEIEGETHPHAQTVASELDLVSSRKKNKGRQRQRKRLKKKMGEDASLENARQITKNPAKKRRKTEN